MSEIHSSLPRLLIVDDEPEIRAVLRDLLSMTYECAEASSAEEALQRLSEGDFKLVISDITMTGISGLEMIPHVKRISPDTVIVMVSGMQTIESAIEALRLGAFDYLMKPFDLRQAEAAVGPAVLEFGIGFSQQRHQKPMGKIGGQS